MITYISVVLAGGRRPTGVGYPTQVPLVTHTTTFSLSLCNSCGTVARKQHALLTDKSLDNARDN